MTKTRTYRAHCPKHGNYSDDGGRCPKCCREEMELSQAVDLLASLPARGKPMPQTIEAWQRLYGLAEKAMKEQDKTISLQKQRINQLEQKRQACRETVKPNPRGVVRLAIYRNTVSNNLFYAKYEESTINRVPVKSVYIDDDGAICVDIERRILSRGEENG